MDWDYSDLFNSDGSTNWGGWNSSGGSDWLSGSTGDSYDWNVDWGSMVGSGSSSSGSSSSGWGDILNGVFGGGSDGGSGSSIWGQMLAGAIQGAGEGKMTEATMREKGRQERATVNFTAELKDYYEQKGKAVKRNALDSYGQFSLTDRYAPNMAKVAPIDVPNKPTLS